MATTTHNSSVFEPTQLGHAPNTCQSVVHTPRGDFLVQVAWPVKWNADRTLPEDEAAREDISAIYLTDGNAYWGATVDIARRFEYTHGTRAIIVGIGYPMPPARAIFDFRRGPDLTPASRDGTYDAPLGRDGKPRTDISFGEADEFLAFLRRDVMEAWVEGVLFAHIVGWATKRKALLGHSYGGIFTLNALYTMPEAWDVFVAASADVEFNKGKFVEERETAFRGRKVEAGRRAPALLVTHGDAGCEMERREGETEARFAKRAACGELPGMRKAAQALVRRLEGNGNVRAVAVRYFPGEDHGSSAIPGFQHGVAEFLASDF